MPIGKNNLNYLGDAKSEVDKQRADVQKQMQDDGDALIMGFGEDAAKALKPLMEEIAKVGKINKEELLDILKNVKVQANMNVPDVIVPEIKIPPINVPDVNVANIHIPEIKVPKAEVSVKIPEIKVPDIIMPKEMDVRGWVRLQGVDLDNPLPVQLRDADGKPVSFGGTSVISGGGGGGKSDYFTIKGFSQSAFSEILNPDGRVKVEMPAGASGLTDIELRASSVPVEQVSGSMWSVSVSGITSSLGATLLNGDGLYRDTMPVSGTVAVSGVTDTVGASIIGSDGLAFGTSKPLPVTMVTGVSASVNAAIINSDGTYRDTFPISGTVIASSVTASVQATIIDSTGIGYSGSNPIPTALVSGYLTSCVAVGATLHDAADIGAAPQKVGGVAVTTANPTAVSGGDIVNFRADDLGRQLIRPVQVRDLISTAYVNKVTGSTFGTETTLLTGVTSTYNDLIYVLASNDSTVAIGVDIRGTLAGNILMHLEIPANGTVGVATPVPIPAGDVGASWTIDLPDVTGTNVYVSALFSKEI